MGIEQPNEPQLARSTRIFQCAVGLLFVSQFFQYQDATGSGMLSRANDTDHYTGFEMTIGQSAATGWQAHHLAIPIIAGLALVYLTTLWRKDFWMRWGHWLTVALMLPCLGGAIFRTTGGQLGLVALALAIWAAVIHRRAIGGTGANLSA